MKIETLDADKIQINIKQGMMHFFGWLIIIGCILALCYLMKEYRIVCKEKNLNKAGQCTLETNILGLYHNSTNLGDLEMATVLSQQSRNKTVYYVVLKTANGLINLTGASSSGRSEKDVAAEGINTYIGKSLETAFIVPYPNPWWYYLVLAFVMFLGIILIMLREQIIVFNGTTKAVSFIKKGLLGASESKIPFSNIEKILVNEFKGSKGTKAYRLGFALKDKDTPLLLANSYEPQAVIEDNARQLNEFIARYR